VSRVNIVSVVNRRIRDFVSQRGNGALLPGTGYYNTPFRGGLFGQVKSAALPSPGTEGPRTAVMLTSMKRPPVSSETVVCGVPPVPCFPLSAPRRVIQDSREVGSSFYSRSSGASGARRRMRGVEGWGRHLGNGARAAAKSTHAFTHPSNLREGYC
jgi:hypothetical protein